MIHQADTIVEILCRRIETDGERPALAVKHAGQFRWLTWNELAGDIAQTTATLVELGISRGDRVAHLSENRLEWVIADFAIQMAGAIHVPIHAPLTGAQIVWQVRHSGAKVLLVSTREQVAKLAPLADQLAGVAVVTYDEIPEPLAGKSLPTLASRKAAANLEKGIEAACHTRRDTGPDWLATILYTSGTTGEPKGVMLTQHNLASNTLATIEAFGYTEDDLRLNFLPLSHIFARTCDLYCWLATGTRMAIAESRETVIADCQAIKPTVLNGVPHFYDRVYRGLCERGLAEFPGALKMALGGEVRICCGGGAALPVHLFDYFHSHGVPLLQGYGLTESSPVISLSSETAFRRGASGRPISGIEVRIADDGEILTRGPHVMLGYYENPEATAEVLKDGWLHTGDLGQLDADNFLTITGRKKEILVTLGGKNIAPVYLESLLTEDPLILQALVVGDDRPCLAALIVPNHDVLGGEIARLGIQAASRDQLLQHPQVLELFQQRINERLKNVAPYEQVRSFALLPRGFTIEAGEMTAKLTLRRKVIEQHFAAEIETLYRRG
ncbi:MAG: long-chain fatty acid--CoA ligase [Planctomycetaceae bacterium]|nr:long-chain fatty acid--CoA ligase [Planctomycetaceae bacterium]